MCFKGNASLNMMKKGTAAFLLGLLFCLTVSQVVKERNEGGNIILSFLPERFNANCSFKVEHNDDVIFCNGTLTNPGTYIGELQNPALVKVERIHNNNIIVHLILESLLRSGNGLYVCVFECPDDIQSKSYELDVIYPPGPAVCGWGKGPNSPFNLECVAQSGNPPGTVLCFTFESEHSFAHFPPVESVSQEDIKAEFMIPPREKVSCCSVSQRFPKHHSNCRDFPSTAETVFPQSGKKDNYPSTSISISAAPLGFVFTMNVWFSVATLLFVLHVY